MIAELHVIVAIKSDEREFAPRLLQCERRVVWRDRDVQIVEILANRLIRVDLLNRDTLGGTLNGDDSNGIGVIRRV